MTKDYTDYTYRAGKKVRLRKADDELVIRQVPQQLTPDDAHKAAEQVSSASTRIRTLPADLEPVMSRARSQAPTHHAYYEESGDAPFLITDRIFVCFSNSPSTDALTAFTAKHGLLLLERFGPRDFLFQVTVQTGMNPVKLVVKLNEEDDLVESAEHDLNHSISKLQLPLPADPGYAQQWHLHTNFNHPDYDPRACSRCEEAWELIGGFGNSAVTVAVTDDGCRIDHSDFDGPDKFTAWAYFRGQRLISVDDFDADPNEMYKAGADHGTSCAGVVAGEIDAQRIVGAAPGCRLLPIQWESSGPSLFVSSSRMLKALNYIADRADIMSNSWGNVPVNVWPSIVVNRITELAQTGGPNGKGMLFLWAAGNENCPISYSANQDIPYTSGVSWQGGAPVWVGVQTARVFENNLVGIDGLMHVAACASNAQRSHYSNYGPGIDLSAPSSNSHTYRRMNVAGLGVTTATGSVTGVTDSFGGTSSATPLVAGVAALVRSVNPVLSATEVAELLKRTASKNLDLQGYPRTSATSFDPNPAWDVSPVAPFAQGDFADTGDPQGTWSPWFGFGRIDALAAVTEALNLGTSQGAEHFQASSSPNLSIPDNDATGVEDAIHCGKVFSVDRVRVRVDVTHTYSGDLLVSLESPSGTEIPLHQRSGGSTHDIHTSFDSQSSPALLQLGGEPSLGAWTLRVRDLAAVDVGRLQSWSLDLHGSDQSPTTVEERPGIIIPDDQVPGIERTLHLPANRTVSSIEVFLDITHTYIGDLRVVLVAPDGTTVALHDRSGGNRDNIIRDFSPINTPALQAMVGRAALGDWRLRVSDHQGLDQGKLNHWQLTVA